ncbi:MAG: HAD-IB family hydrolase [Bryobacterales bacterium]|nr:HAD-IB family hydrolase [Bryobacterales bacterium]
MPAAGGRGAFYDFDGTLVSGNVVTRYAWLAKRHPRRAQAWWRYGAVALGVPAWLALDAISRQLFNAAFFRLYRGLREDWLRAQAPALFEAQIRGEQFKFARDRVARDRADGYRTVLVTGGIDLELQPAAEYFGFDDLLANRLEFRGGAATGAILPPLLAGEAKAAALRAYAAERGLDMGASRAYSDSASDLPMLCAAGTPVATNPDSRLRREARARGWATLDLARSSELVLAPGRPPAPGA